MANLKGLSAVTQIIHLYPNFETRPHSNANIS